MPYLIDGHNLIARLPGLSLSAENDEQQLISLLRGFASRKRQTVEVFFDRAAPGHAGTRKVGAVTAHFISARSSADHAIRDRLDSLGTSTRSWTVVTSDRAVQSAARTRGAAVLSTEEFIPLLFPPGKQPPEKPGDQPLSEEEIDSWLRIFKSKKGKSK